MKKKQRIHHVNPPALVPQQELMGFPDLQLMGVPYSKPHIWRLVKAGRFPKPLKFGAGQNCRCLFRRTDIQEWIERAAA
jgi:predicted DNA-binding transcriptional regulator AlpA